jgi:cardiolipin synthase
MSRAKLPPSVSFVSRRRRWRAMLRPRLGRALPVELRPDRVGRRAEALAGGVRDCGFETLLKQIDESPLHCGDRVQLFFKGDDAVAAMLAAIAAARTEVLLEFYILRDDWTGHAFLEALGAAVARGVRVRVLADAIGSSETRAAFWGELGRRGIEVRLFHRLLPYLWARAFRDHRKILVVDRRVAFTGGMNIGDDYGSTRHARAGVWRDTHARIEGPTAWELVVVFSEGWDWAGGEPLSLPPLEVQPAPGPRTLVLDSRPWRGHAESASVFAALLGAARGRLFVTNSYFAPLAGTLEALSRAAERGVDVRLLLPGPSDVPIVRHAGHALFAGLLARGVRIWEYQTAVLHAKTVVVDGYASVVGSSNLDVRSFRFNAECNVVVLDEGTGATLEQAFLKDLEASEPVDAGGWRRRGLGHRVLDGFAGLLTPVL